MPPRRPTSTARPASCEQNDTETTASYRPHWAVDPSRANDHVDDVITLIRQTTEVVERSYKGAPLYFSESDFGEVDQHAANAPQHVTYDIAQLANYLTMPFDNQLFKLRAIFYWVTHNISYDVESYTSGNYGEQSANAALRNRKGVCAGYADLFTALTQRAGLDVWTVSGGARGGPTRPGDTFFEQSSHAWNAVHINGQYLFIDSTWGSGPVQGNTFEFCFEPYWFLVRPRHMIYSHFPKNPIEQYLNPPIDAQHFLDTPHLKPHTLDDGLIFDKVEVLEPRGREMLSILECDKNGEWTVGLRVPEGWSVGTGFSFPVRTVAPVEKEEVVWRRGWEGVRMRLGDAGGVGKVATVEWEEKCAGGMKVVSVRGRCSGVGEGEVGIGLFKNVEGSYNSWKHALQFRVINRHSVPNFVPFPTLYPSKFSIISPLDGTLRFNQPVVFHFRHIDAVPLSSSHATPSQTTHPAKPQKDYSRHGQFAGSIGGSLAGAALGGGLLGVLGGKGFGLGVRRGSFGMGGVGGVGGAGGVGWVRRKGHGGDGGGAGDEDGTGTGTGAGDVDDDDARRKDGDGEELNEEMVRMRTTQLGRLNMIAAASGWDIKLRELVMREAKTGELPPPPGMSTSASISSAASTPAASASSSSSSTPAPSSKSIPPSTSTAHQKPRLTHRRSTPLLSLTSSHQNPTQLIRSSMLLSPQVEDMPTPDYFDPVAKERMGARRRSRTLWGGRRGEVGVIVGGYDERLREIVLEVSRGEEGVRGVLAKGAMRPGFRRRASSFGGGNGGEGVGRGGAGSGDESSSSDSESESEDGGRGGDGFCFCLGFRPDSAASSASNDVPGSEKSGSASGDESDTHNEDDNVPLTARTPRWSGAGSVGVGEGGGAGGCNGGRPTLVVQDEPVRVGGVGGGQHRIRRVSVGVGVGSCGAGGGVGGKEVGKEGRKEGGVAYIDGGTTTPPASPPASPTSGKKNPKSSPAPSSTTLTTKTRKSVTSPTSPTPRVTSPTLTSTQPKPRVRTTKTSTSPPSSPPPTTKKTPTHGRTASRNVRFEERNTPVEGRSPTRTAGSGGGGAVERNGGQRRGRDSAVEVES
ncbi:hypothetical protein HDV00_007279 [Rhizophlyctis rosea]|nr:hypothetical protein HDV00_007279 [Rhizophlyctis rosea]